MIYTKTNILWHKLNKQNLQYNKTLFVKMLYFLFREQCVCLSKVIVNVCKFRILSLHMF